jgi:hypothetical protein
MRCFWSGILCVAAALTLACGGDDAESQPGASPTTDPLHASYVAGLFSVATEYEIVFLQLEPLTGNPDSQSLEWRQAMIAAYTELKRVSLNAMELEPPACLRDSHRVLVEAARRFERAADLWIETMNTLSTSTAGDAIEVERQADALLEQAVRQREAADC